MIFFSYERIADSELAGWFWPIAPEKTFFHAVLRGAKITIISRTTILTFESGYDKYRIVVKNATDTVEADGGIGWD